MLCIVVAALLLLVIALPMSGESASDAEHRTSAAELRSSLDALRSAIGEYRYDHGRWPVQLDGELSLEALASRFESQLTQHTDASGATSPARAATHPFGPYLPAERLPANPINGLSSVRILGPLEPWPREPDGKSGWIYRPATGELRANCPGDALALGVRFADL
jgi:type II secretory pathway pseudopilin PulG